MNNVMNPDSSTISVELPRNGVLRASKQARPQRLREFTAPWFQQFRDDEAKFPRGRLRKILLQIRKRWAIDQIVGKETLPDSLKREIWRCAKRNIKNVHLLRACIATRVLTPHLPLDGGSPLAECAFAARAPDSLAILLKAGHGFQTLRVSWCLKKATAANDSAMLAVLANYSRLLKI